MISTLVAPSREKRTHGQGFRGTVIKVYWGLTLTSIHSRLSFQKGAPLEGKALSALDLAVSVFPLLSSALLSFLRDTARGGGNMTPAAQPGSAKPSAAGLGPLACTLPSTATARLTWSWYKWWSNPPRGEKKKRKKRRHTVSCLTELSVCRLIVWSWKRQTSQNQRTTPLLFMLAVKKWSVSV